MLQLPARQTEVPEPGPRSAPVAGGDDVGLRPDDEVLLPAVTAGPAPTKTHLPRRGSSPEHCSLIFAFGYQDHSFEVVTPRCLLVGSARRLDPNRWGRRQSSGSEPLIVLGIILLIIGFIAAVHIIWILGIIALVIGAVFAIAGFLGHEIGGRKHVY